MSQRGVSRPMALARGDHGPQNGDGDGENDRRSGEEPQRHDEHGEADQEDEPDQEEHQEHQHMSVEDRRSMLHMHHQQTLWIYWTLPLLGVWMMLAPFNFGHLNETLWVEPSGGRGPWFADAPSLALTELRALLTTVSDVVSGALLLIFGWRSLRPNRPVSLWICCFVGIWLTFAPVVFWAPTAASYVNDSLVGMWLIALTVLIPGMPNMPMFMQHGPATPPGWSYNPSSWPQRWAMIVLGFLGFCVSRYLAMYQLGYSQTVWDPFFGFQGGSKQVLDSQMSHALPISDAGLGTISYTLEFLMGYMGSKARWRTMPWMVAFFGILVIPLGLTHIFLVISQPLLVHAWCTFCLLAALIMLPMIPLEVDEVVAMLQHFGQARKRGDRGGSSWAIFWKGGRPDGCTADESPKLVDLPSQPKAVLASSVWGMSASPPLLVCSGLGVAIMCLPSLFGVSIQTRAADIAHLGGALIVTVSVIALGEVVRLGRFLNMPLALAVALGPWFVDAPFAFKVVSSALGFLVLVGCRPRGPVRHSYGEWDQHIS